MSLLGIDLVLSLLLGVSCSATKGEDEPRLKAEKQESAAEDAATDDDEAGAMAHPKEATAWATRTLIATHAQPTAERVYTCIKQVTQIAEEAGNQQDMMATQAQITQLAANEPEVYHYCFYQMMVRLDDRLALGGPLLGEVATSFFETMRALWILARGLDGLTGRTFYFDYLQRRYVQISKDTFGRDVEVVGPPMGSVRQSFGSPAPVGTKAAGPAVP